MVGIGAFALHQSRHLIAPGAGDFSLKVSAVLAHLAPLLAGLLLAGLSARLVRSRIGGRTAVPGERHLRVAPYALGIAAVFLCQQLLEGALLAGHAGDLAGVFSGGGWAALPLAVLLGAVAALVDRGVEEVEARLSSRRVPPRPRVFSVGQGRESVERRRALTPLAFGIARRPPPARA
ncbi:MAG: hypothetical protein BGO11_01025 [Solirubrobacterales bacterium 70-9]|nr:MAG: hypothetical protein BGO11_01025 [Solirubrobacterales bacterium 70-9]